MPKLEAYANKYKHVKMERRDGILQVDDEYFIVRGHMIRKPIGGFQHCDLARKLINSGHYLYPDFSWGDKEIQRCANEEIGGGPATWIKIDTSHHVAYVVAEVAEFERVTASRAATVE